MFTDEQKKLILEAYLSCSYSKITYILQSANIECNFANIQECLDIIQQYRRSTLMNTLTEEEKSQLEEIYNLRKQGKTYKEIIEYFSRKNIKMNYYEIAKKCRIIFDYKEEEEPKRVIRRKLTNEYDEHIYNLRQQGKSYKQIADNLREMGVDVCLSVICTRCKQIYSLKREIEPRCQGTAKIAEQYGTKLFKKKDIELDER